MVCLANLITKKRKGISVAAICLIVLFFSCSSPISDDGDSTDSDGITALGGTVTISGTPEIGQTLTAITTGLTGQSGTLHYQWKVDNADVGTDIGTYTPGGADKTKTVTVVVTSSGNSGSVISASTEAVAAAALKTNGQDLITVINTITGDSPASPHTVVLSPVVIDTTDTSADGVWAAVNTTIQNAGKYVILDLSDCSAAGNTITGVFSSPSGNDMNIVRNNQYIKGIILPDNIINIGEYALAYCNNLTCVTIPETVISIGRYAFEYCDNLTSVTIPEGVGTIADYAFAQSGLTAVNIPASVTSIGRSAFPTTLSSGETSNLTSINVDIANSTYSSQDGVLFDKAKTTLIMYPPGNNRVSYSIPSSVTKIGLDAFYHSTMLTTVTIPTSVTSFDGYIFMFCSGLISVTIPASVTNIGYSIFTGCTALASIEVDPANNVCSSEGGVLFNKAKTTLIRYPQSHSGTIYSIPSSVIDIAQEAFSGCTMLTDVTISSSITNIGSLAFSGCSGLTSVTIPSSVTKIQGSAFNGCSDLTTVIFKMGSNITAANFGDRVFIEGTWNGGDTLKTAYFAADPHAGTYTRVAGGSTWTKQ
jgi:hypothetical protein